MTIRPLYLNNADEDAEFPFGEFQDGAQWTDPDLYVPDSDDERLATHIDSNLNRWYRRLDEWQQEAAEEPIA